MQVVEIDQASDPGQGQGRLNEDLVGATPTLAWMIDGSTDLPATFRPESEVTGAYWIAHELNRLLERQPRDADYKEVLTRLTTSIDSELQRHQMPTTYLPPACSIGLVSLQSQIVEACIVGDLYIYHLEQDDLLSDDRFDRNEKKAVQAASTETTDEAIAGIEDRRRGYIRGHRGQWVLANNPDVWQGAKTKTWSASHGDHVLLSTDGFARAVTSYDLFADWKTLAGEVASHGAQHVMTRLRQYESRCQERDRFFKTSDDACIAIYRLAN